MAHVVRRATKFTAKVFLSLIAIWIIAVVAAVALAFA